MPDRASQGALGQAESALLTAHTAAEAAPARRRVNVTDPDSRIMSTPRGWVQGYNAQAIVNQHQIVLACDVSQDAGDVQLYEPMIRSLTSTLTAAGIPRADVFSSRFLGSQLTPRPRDVHPDGSSR